MPVSFIQPNYSAGELSPSLYARVDLDKYHSGAKLLRNMFVHPHGGVSNRAGTMFVGRAKDSSHDVQLIPFQFNLLQTYQLEFGHLYMRVIMDGGYVLEPSKAITGVTLANPGIFTCNSHGYSNGNQLYISGLITALNSSPAKQYLVANATSNTFTLTDLDGKVIDTTHMSGIGSGTAARVFTLVTTYTGSDVGDLKYTQSADTLTICHVNYPPANLTRTQHYEWQLTSINFQPSVVPPTSVSAAVGKAGTWNYAYIVTAVTDTPASESLASPVASCKGVVLNSDTGAQNTISWSAVPNAVRYKIYKADPSLSAIPSGAMFGYIGNCAGLSFNDTQIAPDWSQAPPTGANPFAFGGIYTVTIDAPGSGYTSNTPLIVTDATGSGVVLYPTISDGEYTAVTISDGGSGYSTPTVQPANTGSGAIITCRVNAYGTIKGCTVVSGGSNYWGNVNLNPDSDGDGTAVLIPQITNGVITSVVVSAGGNGYTGGSVIVTQDPGTGAVFSCTLSTGFNYPSCSCYFQQRQVFAGSLSHPQTIWMTQPGDYKNMSISNPSRASDAITVTLVSNQVNAIKQLVSMSDLLIFSSGGAWKLFGGSPSAPIAVTPSNIVVSPQAHIGATDLPPIVSNYDILYVQIQGSIVLDLAYNYYANIYDGQNMSVLADHLFYGHTLSRWCYAEQPYYQIWATRDDGQLLSFTFLKEQKVYAWAHSDSPGNSGTDKFLSVSSISEQQTDGINSDSVYVVTQRTIPGVNHGNPVKYIERMDDRNLLTNYQPDPTKSWFVDCGLQYSGSPTTTVQGLDHLEGCTVTILGDGNVQPSQVVVNGTITLPVACSVITVGLPYVAQFQSLSMVPDQMSMQVQDFRKRITGATIRINNTRGIKVGPRFDKLQAIKERTPANWMGQALPLFTGDEHITFDSSYTTESVVCIQQDNPLPMTILGVIPAMNISPEHSG